MRNSVAGLPRDHARANIANADDEQTPKFLALSVEEKIPFSYADASDITLDAGRASFTFEGTRFNLQLPGGFSIMNAIAVIKAAQFCGVELPKIAEALADLKRIPGRTASKVRS